MEEFSFKKHTEENKEIESYLSDSIVAYGLQQLNGFTPYKISVSCSCSSGHVIGAIMGIITLNMLFVSHFYVDEKHRRKGIGKNLLSQIETMALESDCNVIRLNTFNMETNSIYINSGYHVTTRIPNYMNGFDLIYYEKTIS